VRTFIGEGAFHWFFLGRPKTTVTPLEWEAFIYVRYSTVYS